MRLHLTNQTFFYCIILSLYLISEFKSHNSFFFSFFKISHNLSQCYSVLLRGFCTIMQTSAADSGSLLALSDMLS